MRDTDPLTFPRDSDRSRVWESAKLPHLPDISFFQISEEVIPNLFPLERVISIEFPPYDLQTNGIGSIVFPPPIPSKRVNCFKRFPPLLKNNRFPPLFKIK